MEHVREPRIKRELPRGQALDEAHGGATARARPLRVRRGTLRSCESGSDSAGLTGTAREMVAAVVRKASSRNSAACSRQW